jgi:hypothetical protein
VWDWSLDHFLFLSGVGTLMIDVVRKTMPNKSLQATRDGVSSSVIADYVINPACLSFGR